MSIANPPSPPDSNTAVPAEDGEPREVCPPETRGEPGGTLAIDIGGEGTKMLVLDDRGIPLTDRLRQLTPRPAVPEAVLAVIEQMATQMPAFRRVSVGFPGVVVDGIVQTAPNLERATWPGRDLQAELAQALDTPVRVCNDADLQGYGVVESTGVEIVLTLGTGLGSALFSDGHLVPNFELAHHPFRKRRTYEEYMSNLELKRIGKLKWSRRVLEILEQIQPIWNPRLIHLGGGNARKLKTALPDNVRIFTNEEGLRGGIRLWS